MYISACNRIAHSVETILAVRVSDHVDESAAHQGIQIDLTPVDGIRLEREVKILQRERAVLDYHGIDNASLGGSTVVALTGTRFTPHSEDIPH